MNLQHTCDRHALELLLADRLGESEQSALELHLADCPSCRQCLEHLAADDSLWRDAHAYLTDGPTAEIGPAVDGDHALAGLRAYLTPTDDPRLLGRLGGYGVVGLIGCGGFGVVLKAFDAALNRYVAIKALSPQLAMSGAARQRFAREARAAAAVVHDHVVAIHAVAEAEGLPFFVMPYVRGPSLERRLRHAGSLAAVEVLRIGMQVAAGLSAAHAQGLVHRDIKPANILLEDGAERVTITDFGLARAVDDGDLTRSGVIAGTPPYMSPEQAAGLSVDHRSDLFSLGSVLYAMCAGKPPFRGESALAVLRRVEECRPLPVREINPNVPSWLEGIISRLHTKDPALRFQTAAEVAGLLEACLAHLQQPESYPLPPAAATLGQTARTRRRRWPTLAAAAAVATIALLLPMAPKAELRERFVERPRPTVNVERVDNDILTKAEQARAGLQQFRLSLTPDGQSADPLGPALLAARQRAQVLWESVRSETSEAVDRFATDAESARRRLSELGRQVGHVVQ
jgi:serine/threonine-protein kinase